jgi:hypothetical protein
MIEPALFGVSTLKETYNNNYYIISEIDDIINDTRSSLTSIITTNTHFDDDCSFQLNNVHNNSVNNSTDDSNNSVDNSTEDSNNIHNNSVDNSTEDSNNIHNNSVDNSTEDSNNIHNNSVDNSTEDSNSNGNSNGNGDNNKDIEYENDNKKIRDTYDNEGEFIGFNKEAGNDEMVETSDRNNGERSNEETIDNNSTRRDTKDIDGMYNRNVSDIDSDELMKKWDREIVEVNNLVRNASENIAKIIVDVSDETSKYLLEDINDDNDIKNFADRKYVCQYTKNEENKIFDQKISTSTITKRSKSKKGNKSRQKKDRIYRRTEYPNITPPSPDNKTTEYDDIRTIKYDCTEPDSLPLFIIANAFREWISKNIQCEETLC